MIRPLLLKLASGQDDPERCVLGLTVAAAAVASGASTSLWLANEAAWLALPGRAAELDVAHSVPPATLLETILDGGSVKLCTQCAARRSIDPADLIPGITIAGATSFVAEALADDVQALIY